jgi:hypothetical protein
MGAGKTPIWLVIKAHFCASPKKTALLGFLIVVMIAVYVKMFAGGPGSTADAGLIVPHIATPAVVTPKEEGEAREPGSKRTAVSEPLARQLTRDPFVVAGVVPSRNIPVTGHDEGMKAAGLELQSTICGDQPMAVISGHVLEPGDEIGGFTLERVEPTSVWIKGHNVRRELKLRLWSDAIGDPGGVR